MGDLFSKLAQELADSLQADGYVILEKHKSPTIRTEGANLVSPGSFHFTERASQRIKELHKELSNYLGEPSVICFGWGPVSAKDADSDVWRELGVKLTVGGSPLKEVPPAAVEHIEGIPIAFMFVEPLPDPRPRTIDLGPTGFNGFAFSD